MHGPLNVAQYLLLFREKTASVN